MTTTDIYIAHLRDERINSVSDLPMIRAIHAHDTEALRDAINNGGNPNAGEGLAMIAAIATTQFPLVQELANQGASFTFAQKLAKDEIAKWDTIYQKSPGKSPEEIEAIEARIVWNALLLKIDTYQTAYTETQQRLEAQQQNQKLDDIVQAIHQLRETIADITVPRTIQKPLTIPVTPAHKF